MNNLRKWCERLAMSRRFKVCVDASIILATIVVVLDTNHRADDSYDRFLHGLELMFLLWFTLEAAIKIVGYGRNYFFKKGRRGWNWFDLSLVVLGWAGIAIGASWVPVVRSLRLFRLFEEVESLRVLGEALLGALRAVFGVVICGGIVFTILAVAGVQMFQDNDPHHFGDFNRAVITLSEQLIRAEDSADVARTAIRGSDVHPAEGPTPVGPNPRGLGFIAWGYFQLVHGSTVLIMALIGGWIFYEVIQASKAANGLGEDRELSELKDEEVLDSAVRLLRELSRRGLNIGSTQA